MIDWRQHNREFKPATLDFLRTNWDEDHLEAIHINVRPDGSVVLMVGQHRLQTAMTKIGAGELPADYQIPVRTHSLDGPLEESAWIVDHEEAVARGRWTANDKWPQRLAFDPKAQALSDLVRSVGFEIVGTSKTVTRREIKAISTLERIHAHDENGLLVATLSLIRDAWLDQPYSNDRSTLLATAKFIYAATGKSAWTMDRAVQFMAEAGLESVRKKSKNLPINVCQEVDQLCTAMQIIYNESLPAGARKLYMDPADWKKAKPKVDKVKAEAS